MRPPFLDESKWPISKEPEERVVNPSYETQLSDHLIDELFRALEHKDHASIAKCLRAIGDFIHDESME